MGPARWWPRLLPGAGHQACRVRGQPFVSQSAADSSQYVSVADVFLQIRHDEGVYK